MGWLNRLFQALAQEDGAAPAARPEPGTAGTGASGEPGAPAGVTTPAASATPAGTTATPAGATGRPGWTELTRVRQVLDELEGLRPWGDVTPGALAALRQHFGTRSATLAGELMGATKTAPIAGESAPAVGAGAAGETGGPLGAGAAPDAQTGPAATAGLRPSLQAFLADRSILLVSYAGAFLLVVATLLFEIYGAGDFGGGARFGAVLALNLVFGVAGWWCRRQPRLRLVGATYVAIFALTAPLVFLAAYVFVVRDSLAISPDVGLAVAGGACAALYGALGVRLRSRSYSALALAGLADRLGRGGAGG